jgi:hypothetical protein
MEEHMKIDILGTKYDLIYRAKEVDLALEKLSGYCDNSVHKLIVCDYSAKKEDPMDKEDLSIYQRKVARHEIINAFLLESGLAEECEWATEEMVDWFAGQLPKIFKAFQDAKVL